MTTAVKIPPQGGGRWLAFDLRQVMDAIGVQDHLTWRLSDAQIVWPDDSPPESLRTIAENAGGSDGTTMAWADMEALSDVALQVIDGRFTGCREGEPVLSLAAIDSSYWIVWATDGGVLDRVRSAFDGVEDYDEPTPTR